MATFQLEESQPFDVIPEDEVLAAVVESCEERETPWERPDGSKAVQISFRFLITEGQYAGRTIFGNTPTTFTTHPDCKLRIWAQELLGQDKLPAGFKFDTDDLVGLPCRVVIGNRARKAKDGSEVVRDFVSEVLRAPSADSTIF